METTLLGKLVAAAAAEGTPAPGQPQLQGCQQMSGMLLPILLMFVIIYFLIIRPQQKQQKRHRDMLAALGKGDRVITNSGILGTITGLTDNTVTLEIAKNVHIKMLRSHIAAKQPSSGENLDQAVPPGPGGK